MLNINDYYKLVQYILNKNQSGNLTPDDFNRVINQAQVQYVSFLLGSFQQYTPGRPVPRVELGNNQTVRQRLAPVIYGYELAIDSTGFVSYPGDYIQTDAMWSIYGYSRIRYSQQDNLYSVYNSVIDPIASNPIYLIEDEGFRFFPTTTGSAKLSYIRKPPRINWAYDEDVNGRPVYNPTTSEQPVWDEVTMWDIISRLLAMVGVNLQAGAVMQYANEIKQLGQ